MEYCYGYQYFADPKYIPRSIDTLETLSNGIQHSPDDYVFQVLSNWGLTKVR